jgi:FkbM family methyltransferase
MSMFGRLRKAAALLSRPRFAQAALRHRVAAAVDHLEAIEMTAAATLIDIGANKGQFSLAFHQCRPTAKIIAFEPLPDAADRYEALFADVPDIVLHRVALSDVATTAVFHVTDRQDSSSLLKPGAGQQKAFGVREARAIQVSVERLDSRVKLAEVAHPLLIKIDVQGAELQALKGCDDLEQADFIYVELSFVELYENQPLYNDVANYLEGRGFSLAGVFNQVTTAAFGPTQADFLFKRAIA